MPDSSLSVVSLVDQVASKHGSCSAYASSARNCYSSTLCNLRMDESHDTVQLLKGGWAHIRHGFSQVGQPQIVS